ncbi:MAG: hypothetical protein AAFV53_27485 [Myxococcota bacterium]
MPTIIRRTGRRDEQDGVAKAISSLILLLAFSTLSAPAIGNGTTAGTLRTNTSADFRISNRQYTKASTDDLWDLSGETDTAAGTHRAYWLYLDAAGAASIAAGTDASSAALALQKLPDVDDTKSILGVYVAGPATDFNAAGGLAAQGTIYDGIPDGAPCGVPGQTYSAPTALQFVPV